ncbi:MAG: class I SAM-dependent methyltransferase [Dehalococcoidia bacterium]
MSPHDHPNDHPADRSDDQHNHDWTDEAFVADWLARRDGHAERRHRQFAIVRAVIAKRPDQEFRYLNLAAGPGELDEMLLERFPGAVATLVDVSLPLLGAARQRLERFDHRVEYVHASLATQDWAGGVGSGFDFAISTNSLHHLAAPERVGALYRETFALLGHGGILLNLDRVRPEDAMLAPLAEWASRDPDAGLEGASGSFPAMLPVSQHLTFLRKAGFDDAEVLWKDLSHALLFAVRDHFHMPEAAHSTNAGHSHAH